MADPLAKERRGGGATGREDAFVEGIFRFWTWVQANARAVIVGTVLVVLLAAGLLYYRSYRASVQEQGAVELLQLRATAGQDPDLPGRLVSFIRRFDGTPAAEEARLLLARLQLNAGQPEGTLETLEPVADRSPDTPTGYAARVLRVRALEAQGALEPALRELASLAERARYPFQRRAAEADRARLLVESGRLEEAEAIYARLAAETAGTGEDAEYRVRLGEVRALIASGGRPETAAEDPEATGAAGSDAPGSGSDEASSAASAEPGG